MSRQRRLYLRSRITHLPSDSSKPSSLPLICGLLFFLAGALFLAFPPGRLWITSLRWIGLSMEAFGVPREIVAFVIPAGYSFNLDGSTLYLALASIFVAQAAGISMTWTQQLFMVFTLMLTSKGVAGVPRAVLVVLLATAGTFDLPTEPIFLILGVDALIDMARTSVNVTGNCLASAVVARWEGYSPGTATEGK